MKSIIPLALLCASLGVPSLSLAASARKAGPSKVAGVEKPKVKKKKAGAKRAKKPALAAGAERLPNP